MDGSDDYPARLRVSPQGVVWVCWESRDQDIANSNETAHAWYWNGSSWIDSEVPTPTLVPPDVSTSEYSAGSTSGNYISFVQTGNYHIDLTFCHHDGPNEWPSLIHQYVYNSQTAGPGDTSGWAYFECNGLGQ